MAGIPLTQVEERRAKLIELLPLHSWNVVTAGIAAGYSPAYAKASLARVVRKNTDLCRRILARRQELEAGSTDLREKIVQKLVRATEAEGLRPCDLARLSEVLGRINGWMSETRILETGPRTRELEQAERDTARRIALAMQITTIGLPILNPGQTEAQADTNTGPLDVQGDIQPEGDNLTATIDGDEPIEDSPCSDGLDEL